MVDFLNGSSRIIRKPISSINNQMYLDLNDSIKICLKKSSADYCLLFVMKIRYFTEEEKNKKTLLTSHYLKLKAKKKITTGVLCTYYIHIQVKIYVSDSICTCDKNAVIPIDVCSIGIYLHEYNYM